MRLVGPLGALFPNAIHRKDLSLSTTAPAADMLGSMAARRSVADSPQGHNKAWVGVCTLKSWLAWGQAPPWASQEQDTRTVDTWQAFLDQGPDSTLVRGEALQP